MHQFIQYTIISKKTLPPSTKDKKVWIFSTSVSGDAEFSQQGSEKGDGAGLGGDDPPVNPPQDGQHRLTHERYVDSGIEDVTKNSKSSYVTTNSGEHWADLRTESEIVILRTNNTYGTSRRRSSAAHGQVI